jgi:acyl-CoA thioesterase-2
MRTGPEPASLEDLLLRLRLERLGGDLFLGDSGPGGEGTLYGGLVAAQGFLAAASGVEPARPLHSLHGAFLRPGRHDVPIRYSVERIRDGRSFTTRRVRAEQAGEEIFGMTASFALPEDGISHQDPMPEAPPPESLRDWDELRAETLRVPRQLATPVEVRLCDPYGRDPDPARAPRLRAWLRLRGELPEDPLLHTAALIYASDRTLSAAAIRPHGLRARMGMFASLDHAIWIHRPVRLDGWILYASHSPAAHSARGLVFGALYSRDGTRLASVAQEGLIRGAR